MESRTHERGMTLLEILVVIGLMGMFMTFMIPNIMNSLETRDLDNSARDIQTTLEQARFRSMDAKINHRVRFAQVSGAWRYYLENETSTNVWAAVAGFPVRTINSKFTTTISLPTTSSVQTVEFSPVGLVEGYDSSLNSISILSTSLKNKGQAGVRILRIFAGGSIRFERSTS